MSPTCAGDDSIADGVKLSATPGHTRGASVTSARLGPGRGDSAEERGDLERLEA